MEFFRNKLVVVAIIFGVAFYAGAQFPRGSISREAWGLPFVYRYVVREEFRFPEQAYSHFSVFLLFLNVLTLFLGAICTWYFLSWLIWKIRIIVYRLRA